MSQLVKAVEMYEQAVECNPNFGVALANLANAVKELGQVQESVQWYVQAVHENLNFLETVCGTVNALRGVSDWQDQGLVGRDPIVAKLVKKQLDKGTTYGKGILQQSATIKQWLKALALVKTGSMDGLLSTQFYLPPPPPFNGRIKIGYISSDFNNHPLAHLMQSVFGFHNQKAFGVICYATTNSDGSTYRKKIKHDTLDGFVGVAGWDTERVVKQNVEDWIHMLFFFLKGGNLIIH
ncbi:hypothetical protein CROQUDRAFT_133301 [Cronartium quercuum f. sp. fusiforme G11]|uniref:O-GlcNAc transferase C-terminal domain-containing protein n=1 Tax=Cronartium quercuum f. sp. fusiforme G11 TaxID=708437 RepID=A0A9P6NL27_9BASI|nr:hypothetical protein CROQUDRAFT_133301 [Cronartium quercuum f. sp. fusiforme G11]